MRWRSGFNFFSNDNNREAKFVNKILKTKVFCITLVLLMRLMLLGNFIKQKTKRIKILSDFSTQVQKKKMPPIKKKKRAEQ